MKNLQKAALFSLLCILFIPVLGMEKKGEQPTLTWVKSKNNDESISFTDNEKMLSNTLEYMTHGEEPSSQDNPFQLDVSYNTLNICKTIFSGLQTVSDIPEEEKVLNIANFFSQPRLNYDKDEFNFLDIPLVEKAFKLLSQQQSTPPSKRKREENTTAIQKHFKKQKNNSEQNNESNQDVVIIETDAGEQISFPKQLMKYTTVFNNVISDTDDEDTNSIPAHITADSITILKDFLSYFEAIDNSCHLKSQAKLSTRLDHLKTKKEKKLNRFKENKTYDIMSIEIDEQHNKKQDKENVLSKQIASLSEEQKENIKKGIEARFDQKTNTATISSTSARNPRILKKTMHYFEEQNLSFEKIIHLAQLGDYAGCQILFDAAINVAHDHLIANPQNHYDFSKVNDSIATALNEKTQKNITEKKHLNRTPSRTMVLPKSDYSNIQTTHDDEIVIGQNGHNIALLNKITNSIMPLKGAPFQISPDGSLFVQQVYQTTISSMQLQIITIKDKTRKTISLEELFSSNNNLDIDPMIPVNEKPNIVSYHFVDNGAALAITVNYHGAIHHCRYSVIDEKLTIVKTYELPHDDAEFLCQVSDNSDNHAVFIERKDVIGAGSSLFFNNKKQVIPHTTLLLPYCFNHTNDTMITYSDVEKKFTLWNTITGEVINEIEYNNKVYHLVYNARTNTLIALAQPNPAQAHVVCFDTATGAQKSAIDISNNLSYMTSAKTHLKIIKDFSLSPDGKHIVIKQTGGLMRNAPITSILELETGKMILNFAEDTQAMWLPDGSLLKAQATTVPFGNKPVTLTLSYDLYDAQATQEALRSCSLEESLLLERIIKSNAYILNDQEKELYKTLPKIVRSIIKSSIAKQ